MRDGGIMAGGCLMAALAVLFHLAWIGLVVWVIITVGKMALGL